MVKCLGLQLLNRLRQEVKSLRHTWATKEDIVKKKGGGGRSIARNTDK